MCGRVRKSGRSTSAMRAGTKGKPRVTKTSSRRVLSENAMGMRQPTAASCLRYFAKCFATRRSAGTERCRQRSSTALTAELNRSRRALSLSGIPAVSLQLNGGAPSLRLAADQAPGQDGRRTESARAPFLDALCQVGADTLGEVVGDQLRVGERGRPGEVLPGPLQPLEERRRALRMPLPFVREILGRIARICDEKRAVRLTHNEPVHLAQDREQGGR